jgi:hypothetical protein
MAGTSSAMTWIGYRHPFAELDRRTKNCRTRKIARCHHPVAESARTHKSKDKARSIRWRVRLTVISFQSGGPVLMSSTFTGNCLRREAPSFFAVAVASAKSVGPRAAEALRMRRRRRRTAFDSDESEPTT